MDEFNTALRDRSYIQVSRLLKVDGSLYAFLPEDLQISEEFATLALQGGLSISHVNRNLLRDIEFYKNNYELIHRDNSWVTVYDYLPRLVQRMEYIILTAILHSVDIIPMVSLCYRNYVCSITEPSWIKIFAKYSFDKIPLSEQLAIAWHVIPNVKRCLTYHYKMTLSANVLLRCWNKCALSNLPLDVMRNVTTYLISENYSEMRQAMQNLAGVDYLTIPRKR